MPYKNPKKRKDYARTWKKTHKTSPDKKPIAPETSAPETSIAVSKAYAIEIPVLPPPEPDTEAFPKVGFNIALLYVTQEASPESVGVARAWLLQFLISGLGWSAGKINVFFISREDSGGFPRSELSNLYADFTQWYLTITSREIPETDQRKQPDQAKNFEGKRVSRDSQGFSA
jgi:hypothetical protein